MVKSEDGQIHCTIDEYLIAVGRITGNAAAAEAVMFSAFRTLLGSTTQIASAIFYTLDSLHAKSNLLTRLVENIGDEEDKNLIERIISAAKKSNNQRTLVAHALLLFDTDDVNSNFKVLNPKSGAIRSPTQKYLGGLLSESRNSLTEARIAFQKLCNKRGVIPTVELWEN
jgi:hypothetical protein